MSTSLGSGYIVNKACNIFGITVIMLESYFYINLILCSFKIKDIVIKRSLALIQVSNKFLYTAFIMKCLGNLNLIAVFILFTLIDEYYLKTFRKEGSFS